MDQGSDDARPVKAPANRPWPSLSQLREAILDGSGAALFVCDAGARGFPMVDISPVFTAVIGYGESEVAGQSLDFLHGSRTDPRTTKAVNEAPRRSQR